jgi:hypothetical protein
MRGFLRDPIAGEYLVLAPFSQKNTICKGLIERLLAPPKKQVYHQPDHQSL